MTEHRGAGAAAPPMSERDPRLERVIFLSDGVYAIGLTLLAVELVLLEAAADLHDYALLDSLLDFWPQGARLPDQLHGHRELLGGAQRLLPAHQALRRWPDVARAAATSVCRLHTVPHLRDRGLHRGPSGPAVLLRHPASDRAGHGGAVVVHKLGPQAGRYRIEPTVRSTDAPDLPYLAGDHAGPDGACGSGYRTAHQPALLFALATLCFIALRVLEWRNEE
jgi:hypothetical protein